MRLVSAVAITTEASQKNPGQWMAGVFLFGGGGVRPATHKVSPIYQEVSPLGGDRSRSQL